MEGDDAPGPRGGEVEAPEPPSGEITLDQALRYAIDLQQRGLVEGASQVYQRVLAVAPDNPDALHFMGLAEFQLERPERAVDLLQRAVELRPDYADAHNNLGNLLKELGRLDEAAAAYARTLELRADDCNALSNLGLVEKDLGKLAEAETRFLRVIELQPDHWEAHHNLGNLLVHLDRFDDALGTFRRALDLRLYDDRSYRMLGAMLYVSERVDEAAEIYRRWHELEPDDPEPVYMLSACTGQNVPERASDGVVRQIFDRFADSFDRVLLENLDYRAPQLIAQAVEGTLGAPAAEPRFDALDAGCGTGLCGPWMRRYARRLVGVDLSPRMLERAAARGGYDELVAAELTAYMLDHEGAYDLIVSADTLVYFGDLSNVIPAAARALRAGGHLVFTVERSSDEDAPDGFRIHPHGRYSHTDGYLRTVLGAAGLHIVSIERAHLRTEGKQPVNGWVALAAKER